MVCTNRQSDELFNYWFTHTDNLCECCKNYKYLKDNIDNGEYRDNFKGSPCETCFEHADAKGFVWNGKVK